MSRGGCKISIVIEGAVPSITLLKETEDFYYEQTE